MQAVESLDPELVLRVERLSKVFMPPPRFGGHGGSAMAAVQDVSFGLNSNETLGIVGESGCGKSTLARCIAGLTALTSGQVLVRVTRDGKEHVVRIGPDGRGIPREFRSAIQLVFQNPHSAFDPRRTIGQSIAEGLGPHCRKKNQTQPIHELLHLVGLDDSLADCWPSMLSGGQLQRCGIARALAANPQVLICDEIVSSLDPSVQAQVLNMLVELQRRRSFACIFIAHDLRLTRYMSQRIAVMYRGQIVEIGPSEAITSFPVHPYTAALIEAASAGERM